MTAAGGATIGAVGGPRWRPDSSGPRVGCHGNGYNATGKTFPSVKLKVEDLNLEKAKRRGGGMMYMAALLMMYMAALLMMYMAALLMMYMAPLLYSFTPVMMR